MARLRVWILLPLLGSLALLSACGGGGAPASGAPPAGPVTPAAALKAVQDHMVASTQVNKLPHVNTMTHQAEVNVYQVSAGIFAYTSSMAIDTDGSDPDPDPDHQDSTCWQDENGADLGAHRVPYYVLGDEAPDGKSPSDYFFYKEHGLKGLQFALIFYQGKVIGAVFGDTQGPGEKARQLGEASVRSAERLGIPSSGTTGGVDGGVTVVIFGGADWVVKGSNANLDERAQALVQKALDLLGNRLGGS